MPFPGEHPERFFQGHDYGRFFIAGNSTKVFMDRNFFTISFSQDSAKFGEVYRLFNEPTAQGFQGHLKTNGYQDPACMVEQDRILLGYAVNKEEMEIGIIDTSATHEREQANAAPAHQGTEGEA